MNAARRDVLATVLRALGWLPLTFALWYLAAAPVSWVPARLAAIAIAGAAGKVERMEVTRPSTAYSVLVEGPYRPGRSDRAQARVEVAAAIYTVGIALFAALALASHAWRTPARAALGLALLLPLPAVGKAFDALRQLGSTAELAGLLAWPPAMREAIALGYQAGSLLLPTLAPVIVWLALFPSTWRRPAP